MQHWHFAHAADGTRHPQVVPPLRRTTGGEAHHPPRPAVTRLHPLPFHRCLLLLLPPPPLLLLLLLLLLLPSPTCRWIDYHTESLMNRLPYLRPTCLPFVWRAASSQGREQAGYLGGGQHPRHVAQQLVSSGMRGWPPPPRSLRTGAGSWLKVRRGAVAAAAASAAFDPSPPICS